MLGRTAFHSSDFDARLTVRFGFEPRFLGLSAALPGALSELPKEKRRRKKTDSYTQNSPTIDPRIGGSSHEKRNAAPVAEDRSANQEPMRPMANISQHLSRWGKWVTTDRWMVVLTAFLIVISYQQCDISRNTLVFANRAYVVPKEARIMHTIATQTPTGGLLLETPTYDETAPFEQFTAGEWPYLDVVFVNSGTTPAYFARPAFDIQIRQDFPIESEVMPSPTLDLGVQSARVIGKDTVSIVGSSFTRAFTAEDILAMTPMGNGRRPTRFLMIYGTYDYNDIFDEKRNMKFCFFYNWPRRVMSACPSFNVSD